MTSLLKVDLAENQIESMDDVTEEALLFLHSHGSLKNLDLEDNPIATTGVKLLSMLSSCECLHTPD